jgi:hypothetical protein
VVGKSGRLPTQCLIDQELTRGVREMIIPSNHMTDMHEMIIDDTSKIISGHPVRPEDDEISDSLRIKVHLSMDKVFKNDRTSLHVKSEDRVLAFGFHF